MRLDFGLYTSDEPVGMVRQFRPVLSAMESDLTERLGEPVRIRMQIAPSYAEGLHQIATGGVDFSRVGPASYVLAKMRSPDISILAMEQIEGKKVFEGFICVAEQSSINALNDLRGRRFAFGDENSTIGRYLSQMYLLLHGIKASDLAYYEYLGRHDKVGSAVAAGVFDAGALKDETFHSLTRSGTPLRVIASFPNVTKPWIARAGLSEDLQAALRNALLQIRSRAALQALGVDGFVVGRDQDFAKTRAAIEQNSLFFQ